MKEKIKRIQYIIRGKEYCHFDIVIDKDNIEEFKKFVELMQFPKLQLKNAIANPDYIIKDKSKKDTGLVVKEVSTEGMYVYLVLRICTDSKEGKWANSIISGWHISRKRLKNYLRNCTILYKGE